MRKTILAAGFSLLASLASAAPEVRAIDVRGAGVLSRGEILDLFALRPGEEWNPSAESTAVERVLAAYAARGYFDAEITARAFEEDAGVRIELAVREGHPVTVETLRVEGIERFPSGEVEGRFDTRAGKVLEASRLEGDMDRALAAYGRSGYPFARVLLSGVDRTEKGLGVSLRVVEGPYLVLGDLKVSGNERTKPSTLRRLSGLRFGEPYDQSAVDASRLKLSRSGLFQTVSEPAVRVKWKEKEAVVEMSVVEARSNRIAGAIGYAPGAPGRSGIVSGYADVSFRNILGAGRSGGARWERPSADTRRVRLFYREPWVLGSPFALGGEMEQDIRDSTYTRESGALTSDVDLSRRVSASFTAGIEAMRPRRDASSIPRSSRRKGGVGIVFEGRDVPQNPTRGLFTRIAAEYGVRKIEGEKERGIEGERVRQATLEAGFGVYRGITERTVASWEVQGIGRFTNEAFVPPYDQFYLGGARTLRGYEEDQFRGARLAWSRIEYRYLLGALSRLFLFFDSGYVFAESEDAGQLVRSEKKRNGYGFGLRFDSAIGILGVDYGLGEGDRFGEGKLHVSAEGDF